MKYIRNNKIAKWGASGLLIFAILTISYAPSPTVHRAEAGGGGLSTVIEVGENLVVNALSEAYNFITSTFMNSLWVKEYVLDPLLWSLINIAIQSITQSLVEWINSGFAGSPAFVTDLEGFLLSIADRQVGALLTEVGLGFMCSPFKLEVQLALEFQYLGARDFGTQSQCTLSGVIDNIEGFVNTNSIADGGWAGWFSLTTRPTNNPYGELMIVQAEAAARVTNAQGEHLSLLGFGEGVLSYQQCEDYFDAATGETDTSCSIVTPGAVIEAQLNKNLDSGRERLIVADEIDEILSALFAQLVQQVFTGVGGLLGVTQSGYTSDGLSYIQAATGLSDNNIGDQIGTDDPFTIQIDVEERYLALLNQAVSMINNAQLYEQNTYNTDCSSTPFPQSLINTRTSALNQITATENLIALLEDMRFDYENTNDPTVREDIINTFLDLQANGVFHDETDVVLYDLQVIGNSYMGITLTINNYEQQVDLDCSIDNTAAFSPEFDFLNQA